MKIHPFADRFPMLAKEALEELAEDIKVRGQIFPILIDSNGVLIDGRNRLAACKLAKIEPRFETWIGDDPLGLILSVNVHRRHITVGAKAMAVALVHLEPAKRGGKPDRGKSNLSSRNIAPEVPETTLAKARTIIREFGPDSVEVNLVLHGEPLTAAYEKARAAKLQREQQAAYLRQLQERVGELDQDDIDFGVTLTPCITPLDDALAQQIKDLEAEVATKTEQRRREKQAEIDAREAERRQREAEATLARLEIELRELIEKAGSEPAFITPSFAPETVSVHPSDEAIVDRQASLTGDPKPLRDLLMGLGVIKGNLLTLERRAVIRPGGLFHESGKIAIRVACVEIINLALSIRNKYPKTTKPQLQEVKKHGA